MPWTADDLIASAKRRGAIPTAQVTWQPADFLSVADEEIVTYMVPLVQKMREEYYLQQDDYVIPAVVNDALFFRLPDRALGGATRDVLVMDSNSVQMDIPRITQDDLTMASWGYYVLGGLIGYVNRSNMNTPRTLRITYYLRPSSLSLTASVASVQSFDSVAKTVTLDSVPTGYSGNQYWDIVRARPNFEMLFFDAPGALDVPTRTITFIDDLPTELAIGDRVALQEKTPIPQLPAELHPLLAQRLAVKFLEAQGESEQLSAAMAIAARMEQDVAVLLSPRMAGEPRKIIPRDNTWRRWRR